MASLSQFLAKYKTRDLPLPKNLVTLRHPEQTLFDAMRVLSENHFLSAPVLDVDGHLMGTLDALDIVRYVVKLAMASQSDLIDHPLEGLMGKAGRQGNTACRVVTVGLDDSMESVADTIAGPARRAVVLAADGSVSSIVTQSTLLQFLVSKRDEIAWDSAGKVKDHATPGAMFVSETDSALNAFVKLDEMQVSSLVILDQGGRVINMVSATDLVQGLAIMPDKASAINELKASRVLDFALANRRDDLRYRESAVSMHPAAALFEAVEKLALTRLHRLVVMGEDRKAIGVLSLSDICRAFGNPGRLY